MAEKRKPRVLITSYLDPVLAEEISHRVPEVDLVYRPDLLYRPRHATDHTSLATRTPEQEKEWIGLLSGADIMFDFDQTHLDDLPSLALNLKWIQGTSSGIGQFVRTRG